MEEKLTYKTLSRFERDTLADIFKQSSLTEIRACLLERGIIDNTFPEFYHDCLDGTVKVLKSSLPKTKEDDSKTMCMFQRILGFVEGKMMEKPSKDMEQLHKYIEELIKNK